MIDLDNFFIEYKFDTRHNQKLQHIFQRTKKSRIKKKVFKKLLYGFLKETEAKIIGTVQEDDEGILFLEVSRIEYPENGSRLMSIDSNEVDRSVPLDATGETKDLSMSSYDDLDFDIGVLAEKIIREINEG